MNLDNVINETEKRFDSILTGRADQIKQNALELVLEMTVA